MTVQSATVYLHPPERRTDPPLYLDEVTINAVLVKEVDPPAGEDAGHPSHHVRRR